MKSTFPLLRTALLLVVGLTLVASQIGATYASTPTANQAPQEMGTPTPGGACDAAATPFVSGQMHDMPGGGMMSGLDFDLAFIYMMIPHHEGAIAMAQVAIERGEHEEIRALAEDIVATQSAEIDQLQSWRAEWYPDAPETVTVEMMPMNRMDQMMGGMDWQHMMAMDPMMDAASLCSTTEPFDLAFIDMMIPHHVGAVMMAEIALQRAVHAELRELASDIIEAQQREIDQMREWRASWYPGSPEATPAARSESEQVDVSLDEFSVTAPITEFHVGQRYRFVASNHGALSHELMILPTMPGIGQADMEELHHVAVGVIPVDDLTPGATQTIEVMFTQPGTFELVCALPGHYEAGMKLIVEVDS